MRDNKARKSMTTSSSKIKMPSSLILTTPRTITPTISGKTFDTFAIFWIFQRNWAIQRSQYNILLLWTICTTGNYFLSILATSVLSNVPLQACGGVWEYLRVRIWSEKPKTDLEQGSKQTTILTWKTILYFRVFSRINLLITFSLYWSILLLSINWTSLS